MKYKILCFAWMVMTLWNLYKMYIDGKDKAVDKMFTHGIFMIFYEILMVYNLLKIG